MNTGLVVEPNFQRRDLPSEVSGEASLLAVIARAASDPSVDIDKMERLMQMHERITKQKAEAAFNSAMSAAQAKILPVANNAANEQTHSRYAKLAAINKAITPIYTAEGLSISFDSGDAPSPDLHRTVAIVSHASGFSRQYHLDMPLDDVGAKGNANKTKVHATGSTKSYSRRYLICMIFNVTTEDDNDGNGDSGKKGMDEKQRADFDAAIEALTDKAGATALWGTIVKVCQDTGDKAAYDALKAKIAEKGKTL